MHALSSTRATTPAGARPRVPCARTIRPAICIVRAQQQPQQQSSSPPPSGPQQQQQQQPLQCSSDKLPFMAAVDRMFERYDFVSTGCGALAVTGYCVARGQDPGTAALITVVATVTALVANELLFDGRA